VNRGKKGIGLFILRPESFVPSVPGRPRASKKAKIEKAHKFENLPQTVGKETVYLDKYSKPREKKLVL
jgi:hypothetical protein